VNLDNQTFFFKHSVIMFCLINFVQFCSPFLGNLHFKILVKNILNLVITGNESLKIRVLKVLIKCTKYNFFRLIIVP